MGRLIVVNSPYIQAYPIDGSPTVFLAGCANTDWRKISLY